MRLSGSSANWAATSRDRIRFYIERQFNGEFYNGFNTLAEIPGRGDAVSRGIAKLEAAAKDTAYGRIAMLADPFGHGFCLLQFNERGYDALL